MRSLAFACLLALAGCSPSPVQHPGADRMRACLDELAADRGDWSKFSVTYDDVHALHGGLTLSIYGDGRVEQHAVRVQTRESRDVLKGDLKKLLALLRELQAWEQRTPERQAVPDESISSLTIRCGGDEVKIWEWYNEMAENARISRVRDLMSQLALQPTGGPALPKAPVNKKTRAAKGAG
jgi:hypothetical protein